MNVKGGWGGGFKGCEGVSQNCDRVLLMPSKSLAEFRVRRFRYIDAGVLFIACSRALTQLSTLHD